MATTILLLLLITLAFIQDVRESKIANWITIPGMAIGLLSAAVFSGGEVPASLLDSLMGLIAGFLLMFLLFALGAVGAGDVKLFGAIGAIGGLSFVLHGIVHAVIFGGLVGLSLLVWKREVRHRLSVVGNAILGFLILRELHPIQRLKKEAPLRFPFMYAVAPAIGLTWWIFYY